MSIYSGFATRLQEQKYNELLWDLIIALKKRVLKFYAGESCNELKFGKLIRALYVKLNKMEQGKFIQPKFSESINDMLNGLQRSEIPTRLSTLDRMPTDSFLDLRQNAIRESRIEGDKGDSTQILALEAQLDNSRNYLRNFRSAQHIKSRSASSTMKKFKTIDMRNERKEIPYQPFQQFGNSDTLQSKIDEFKQMREMMRMPKVEKFMPKKRQIEPFTLMQPLNAVKEKIKYVSQRRKRGSTKGFHL